MRMPPTPRAIGSTTRAAAAESVTSAMERLLREGFLLAFGFVEWVGVDVCPEVDTVVCGDVPVPPVGPTVFGIVVVVVVATVVGGGCDLAVTVSTALAVEAAKPVAPA
jgi:hypothetical protein